MEIRNNAPGFEFYNYHTLVHFAERAPFLKIWYIKQTDLVTKWKNRCFQLFIFRQT